MMLLKAEKCHGFPTHHQTCGKRQGRMMSRSSIGDQPAHTLVLGLWPLQTVSANSSLEFQCSVKEITTQSPDTIATNHAAETNVGGRKRHSLNYKNDIVTWWKPVKYFHSERWKLSCKLTRASSGLVLLVMLGREGSCIFPWASPAAFLPSLGGWWPRGCQPLHTSQLWSALAFACYWLWCGPFNSLICWQIPVTTEGIFFFWPGCRSL